MTSQFFVSVHKRRVRVVVHEDQATLAAAAKKHEGDDEYSKACAVFHPAYGQGDYYGTIRLHRGELNVGAISHECFHLVCHIARQNDLEFTRWAYEYGEKEEALADLVDRFTYSICQKVQARYL